MDLPAWAVVLAVKPEIQGKLDPGIKVVGHCRFLGGPLLALDDEEEADLNAGMPAATPTC